MTATQPDHTAPEAGVDIFVARQPIFRRDLQVHGYELLYRGSPENTFDGTMRDHGPGAKKPELEGGTVPAGKCLSGWVTFTVPEKSLPTGVVYDGSSRLIWTVPLPKGAHPTTTTTGKTGAGAAVTTTTDGSATTPSDPESCDDTSLPAGCDEPPETRPGDPRALEPERLGHRA